jgi:hypothetical protein
MSQDLRAFLAARERELHTEIERLHRELRPLEAELADVRRARNAIAHDDEGAPESTAAGRVRGVDEFEPMPDHYSPYQRLTMKQLTVKALQENFPNGATANKLIQFFHDAWNRKDVVRSSFSPQLSRLKSEGIITRRGNVWFMAAEKEKGPEAVASEPSPTVAGDVAERSIAPDSRSGEGYPAKDAKPSEGSNPSVSAPFTAQESTFRQDLLSTSQLQFPDRDPG